MAGWTVVHSLAQTSCFEYASDLVDFGLAHYHGAVHESFLHCLGHLYDDYPDFVERKVAGFLARKDLNTDILEYAKLCREGAII